MEANNKGPASPATDRDASLAVHKDTTAMVADNKDAVSPATTLPPAVGKDTVKTNALLATGSDDEFDDDDDEFSDDDDEVQSEQERNMDQGTPMIDKHGTDLTKLAFEGKLNLSYGKEELVERVVQILCRRNKCSPCLVGYPGVWKTAIIEGLAKRIRSGMVPHRLKEKKVISFTSRKPKFGTYLGEPFPWFTVTKEIERSGDMIVFFDECYTISNIGFLESTLVKGDLQCIGATHNLGEYTRHPVLRGLFQAVEVSEPSVDDTIKILKGVCGLYETHHKVCYTEEALVAAVELSSGYLSKYNGTLLDKAVDLIDEAGSRVQLLQWQVIDSKNKDQNSQLDQLNSIVKTDTDHNNDDRPTMIKKEDVQHVVSSQVGIPVYEVSQKLSDQRLLKLEETLRDSVIGQDEALTAIGNAVRRARVGLTSSKRPIASFLFTGPVGVGKTEIAKALASQCFGSEDYMAQFDMSEYMQKHQVSRLIGTPPGYIMWEAGGQLTEAVRRKPHTVLLFNDIETAHPDILDLMLQILDNARLKDNRGNTVDFTNTIIIFTSNIGSEVMNERNSSKAGKGKIDNMVMEEINKYFRPEFLSRIDEIIVFKQLSKEAVTQIADLMFKEVGNKLKGKGMKLIVSDEFKARVVKDGSSPSHGARHLRRAITAQLENPLAKKILSNDIKEGDSVFVDVDFGANAKVLDKPSSEGKKKWFCLFG